jgi:hypothetical protein
MMAAGSHRHGRAGLAGMTAVLATACALAATASAAPADDLSGGKAVRVKKGDVALRPAMQISPNWSGYVATAPPGKAISYTSVTGTWTVPKAICSKKTGKTYSTVWVGLGGWTQTRQEEVGTNANCTPWGKPRYYAWFELVPYLSFPTDVKKKVFAGDTITGVVRIVKSKVVVLRIKNRTRHWTFTRRINWWNNDTSTADWIVEAPAECLKLVCSEASLANFRSVTMRGISATGMSLNGAIETGTLANRHWRVMPVRLVPGKMTVPFISTTAISASHRGHTGQAASPAGSTPGPVSKDGRRFTTKWVKVATKGI